MKNVETIGLIVLIIVGILVLLYLLFLLFKINKTLKKVDYAVDDVIYKLDLLNHPLETVKKLFNYIDIFDIVSKKNLHSLLKWLKRNNFVLYKFIDVAKKTVNKNKKTVFKTTAKKKDINK